jgi:hypothetical protein
MISQWSEIIMSLRPTEISMYLRAKGWVRTFTYENNYGSIWSFTSPSGEEVEVILPEDTQLRDYRLRMIELFNTLEIVENRPKLSIVHDISVSGADVIRFRISSSEANSGTIPLMQATSLTKGVETALLAAACATILPKSYFPRMSYNEAKDYLSGCKMGQSERGSYVLTVLSPVAPSLMTQGSLFPEYEDEDAFERRVLYTLFNGLHKLKQALATGTVEAIEETVNSGVSANLCEALTLMQPNNDAGELEIGVSWAPIRPLRKQVPAQRVKFSKDVFPLLVECVKYLRQTAPIEGYEMRGYVRKLESTDANQGGRASVIAVLEGKPININMELPASSYKIAVSAHATNSLLCCSGTLEKEGKGYKLTQISDLRIDNRQEF